MMEDCWGPVDAFASAPERPPGRLERTSPRLRFIRSYFKDIREQYEPELRETKEALGEAHLQIYALKKFKRLLDEDENS